VLQEMELLKSLFHINRLLFQEINKIFAVKGLNPTEVMILYCLKHGDDCKVSDLAFCLGIPLSTLTGILDRLAEKGLISRERSDEDRRVVTVKLAPSIFNEHKHIMQSCISILLDEILAETSPEWRQKFQEDLAYLEKLLEKRGETVGRK
jgi:DNA-binding MarR family transcriptional regulator